MHNEKLHNFNSSPNIGQIKQYEVGGTHTTHLKGGAHFREQGVRGKTALNLMTSRTLRSRFLIPLKAFIYPHDFLCCVVLCCVVLCK